MASMAPTAAPAATPPPAAPAPKPGAQHVVLKLAESSWVELVGADGSRIEYAMLPAHTVREYQIAGRAMLRIGNIRGARLEVDGNEVDLQPLAHANVARVNLGEGAVAPVERQ
jgi:cytoskeleton protein RodZ